jgi:elongator complex protein 3
MSKATSIKPICREIIDELMQLPSPSKDDLARAKLIASRKYRISPIRNSIILQFVTKEEREKLLRILRIKPVRTISGVTTVTVMTKPYPCPHGKCTYCMGYPVTNTPSAYTGEEPACLRAIQNNYDPYKQVKTRIQQLRAIGHCVDKIELIIFGGTFTALPVNYQEEFIQRCLDAITGVQSRSLEGAISNAEVSEIAVSNICIETRPDWAKEKHIDQLLKMVVTRIELGVQNIYDDIYEIVERGHTVEDVIEATRIVRDSGMMFVYHMMPGLPGSDYERDLEAFRTLFDDPRFRPDMLKIYPCLITEGTKLYYQWLRGEYEPYSVEKMIDLIARIKSFVPEWVRIMRIQRDIPAKLILVGVKKSNLRQLVAEKLREIGLKCRCIRCREVGHIKVKKWIDPNPDHIKLCIRRYAASEGEEVFLSYEDVRNDILIALLRLRWPSEKVHRKEVREMPSMLVRQLQTYGPIVKVGQKPRPEEWQHRGYGKALLKEAERIAKEEFDAKKIVILSGIGVRRYYAKFGYRLEGPYMTKILN